MAWGFSSQLLKLLSHMRFLQQLELAGNPCCEEPDYRYHVLNKLPSLHLLDSHVVTDQGAPCLTYSPDAQFRTYPKQAWVPVRTRWVAAYS